MLLLLITVVSSLSVCENATITEKFQIDSAVQHVLVYNNDLVKLLTLDSPNLAPALAADNIYVGITGIELSFEARSAPISASGNYKIIIQYAAHNITKNIELNVLKFMYNILRIRRTDRYYRCGDDVITNQSLTIWTFVKPGGMNEERITQTPYIENGPAHDYVYCRIPQFCWSSQAINTSTYKYLQLSQPSTTPYINIYTVIGFVGMGIGAFSVLGCVITYIYHRKQKNNFSAWRIDPNYHIALYESQ